MNDKDQIFNEYANSILKNVIVEDGGERRSGNDADNAANDIVAMFTDAMDEALIDINDNEHLDNHAYDAVRSVGDHFVDMVTAEPFKEGLKSIILDIIRISSSATRTIDRHARGEEDWNREADERYGPRTPKRDIGTRYEGGFE